MIHIGEILSQLFSLYGVFIMSLGVTVGILGGALPGVSTTMTVALVATGTYTMDPLWAITFLAATQVGSTYGGSIAATVLNIPGTPSAAATALEGYPLTRKGEAAKALSVNAISSFFGNTIGAILLVITLPYMLKLSMKFGPWELFWFAIFGVVICAKLSRANFVKGLIASSLGLFLAMIGIDPIWGTHRFTFDILYLTDGIPLIPAMVGLYGMSEVFTSLTDHKVEPIFFKEAKLFQFNEWAKYKILSLRAALLGFIIGVIPGVGANIASWVGYDHAYSTSKQPEQFGKGSIEGLVGSESANNACVPGAYAPLLVLGVPGDAVTAIILGVLVVHGVQPGPTFLRSNPDFLYQIALAIIFSGVLFLILGTFIGRGIIKLLVTPLPAIMATVTLLCVIGSYAISFRIEDVYLMFIFGILGMSMKKFDFPIAPLILGLILGGTLGDANFRRSIIAGKGSFLPFITRPISLVMVIMLVIVLFFEFVYPLLRKKKQSKEV